MTNLGNKIAEARKSKNMTQEQLAERMSVTRQSISRWESGQSYPEMEKMVTLARVLEVSCDYLLTNNSSRGENGCRPEPVRNPVTRLLRNTKGRKVKLTLYDDATDYELLNKVLTIVDFDGHWVSVEYMKKKETCSNLILISSIRSIQFVKEE